VSWLVGKVIRKIQKKMESVQNQIKNIAQEPEQGQESAEVVPEFNFPEMQEVLELSEAVILKMKDKIDAGAWDLLISDEVGGRVPTLIFKGIYKARNPEKDFDTIFVNGGVTDTHAQKELVEYLKAKKDKQGEVRSHPIFITQFVGSGMTVNTMANILSMSKVGEELDVATLTTFFKEVEMDEFAVSERTNNSPKINLYIGKDKSNEPKISSNTLTKVLTAGVVKPRDTKAIFPIKTEDYISTYHSELGTKYPDLLDAYTNPELSIGQKKEINAHVTKARQDIESITKIILQKVWGAEK
jgi:hypothetical protein